jgi:hypothetical protein
MDIVRPKPFSDHVITDEKLIKAINARLWEILDNNCVGNCSESLHEYVVWKDEPMSETIKIAIAKFAINEYDKSNIIVYAKGSGFEYYVNRMFVTDRFVDRRALNITHAEVYFVSSEGEENFTKFVLCLN